MAKYSCSYVSMTIWLRVVSVIFFHEHRSIFKKKTTTTTSVFGKEQFLSATARYRWSCNIYFPTLSAPEFTSFIPSCHHGASNRKRFDNSVALSEKKIKTNKKKAWLTFGLRWLIYTAADIHFTPFSPHVHLFLCSLRAIIKLQIS